MKNKDLIILGVLTLMTVIFWMITEVMHTSQKSTITPVLQQDIRPIVPTFDTKVIKMLKSRQGQ